MTTQYTKPKLAFVQTTMSGFDAVLDVEEVRDMSLYSPLIQGITDRLSEYANVHNYGIVGDEAEAVEVREWIRTSGADIMLVWPINYTLDTVMLALASGQSAPLVILNTAPRTTIADDCDFGQTMENNAVACIPTMTNVLIKNGLDYELVSGGIDDENLYYKLGNLIKASAVCKFLRTARIGVLGRSYPGISAISADESLIPGKFGTTLVPMKINAIAAAFAEVSKEATQAETQLVKSRCTPDGIAEDEICASAQLSVAIQKIVEKDSLSAIAGLCQLLVADDRIGTVPCHANTILTEQGIPVTCECDVHTALAALMLQNIANDVTFLEFYTQDYENGYAMLSHCGQGNLLDAAKGSKVSAKAHPCYPGARGCGVSYEYLMKPGDVTYACLTYIDGKWIMVAGLGESLEQTLRPTATVQMYFRFKDADFFEAYDKFCRLGGFHHFAISYGDHLPVLEKACKYMGVEFRKV